MTLISSHVSMLDMRHLLKLLILICFFSQGLLAYEATVSVYTFENKATNTSKKIKLEERTNPLPVEAPWFDWTCTALKQVDGVNISCEHGGDIIETKIFCYVQNSKEARYLKVNKGENFISFEAKCALTSDERRSMRRAKLKKSKKSKAPVSELIPVPPPADQDSQSAPQSQPSGQPELQVTPPPAEMNNPPMVN